MGFLKYIHDNAKAGAEAPINPLIADGGAQIISRIGLKAIAKTLDKETGDYVLEGKIQGYEDASDVYEKKLIEQADRFLQQKKVFLKEREEYEALLDAYDKKIQKLQEKSEKSQQEITLLNELLIKERELRELNK